MKLIIKQRARPADTAGMEDYLYLVVHPVHCTLAREARGIVIHDFTSWSEADCQQLVDTSMQRIIADMISMSRGSSANAVILYECSEDIPGLTFDGWTIGYADAYDVAHEAARVASSIARPGQLVVIAGTVRDDCVRRSAAAVRAAGFEVRLHEQATLPMPPATFNETASAGERQIPIHTDGVAITASAPDWDAANDLVDEFYCATNELPYEETGAAIAKLIDERCEGLTADDRSILLTAEPSELECWLGLLIEFVEQPEIHGLRREGDSLIADPGSFPRARFASSNLGPVLRALALVARIQVSATRQLAAA